MITRSPIHLFKFLALVLILAQGCARQTEIVKLYDDNTNSNTVYRRLLVIDVSSDPNRQQFFEDEVVRELRRKDNDAIASHATLKFAAGVSQEEITALGHKIGADGVLLTRFVSVESTVAIEEGRSDTVSTCRRGSLADYFLYDHDVIREPDSVKAAHEVVVVSSLYDVATQKRVWSIQSTCFEKSSMSEVLLEEARVIAKQLRDDGRI